MNRINCLSNFIDKCKCVYDVGSDHALFSISLLRDKKAKRVVNIEISEAPLSNGISNLEKNNLLDKTENIVNNGMNEITRLTDSRPNYVCIAGMGGNSIIHILRDKDPEIKAAKYVLQANTEVDVLRRWLGANKWKIIKEQTLLDRDKYYQIILAEEGKTKQSFNEFDAFFGKESKQIDKQIWYQFVMFVKHQIEAKNLNKFNSDYAYLYKHMKEHKRWK